MPWNEQFTPDELSDFIPGFLSDGTAEDGRLLIFPVSKSMQLLMCNGSGFDRFSAATGVGYEDLATWEGFYDAAGRFYDWSAQALLCARLPHSRRGAQRSRARQRGFLHGKRLVRYRQCRI